MGLVLSGVTVHYPGAADPAVHEVSLAVTPGERVAIVGENGSGKSTILGVWAGLLVPKSGTASVFGTDASASPDEVARRVGWAPAEPIGFAPRLSVRENLRFFAALYALDDVDRRSSQWPELELEPLLSRPFQTLSVGQRARVALARAMFHDPDALLIDEATRSLDPRFVDRVHALFHAFAARGRAVVLVTHDVAEAQRCDRIVLLRAGRVAAEGPPPRIADALAQAFSERP